MAGQPVQWQAAASRGGALTRNRVRPRRQPPSQGSFQSVIALLLAAIQTDSLRFGEARLLMSMTAVCSAGYLRATIHRRKAGHERRTPGGQARGDRKSVV